MPIPPSVVVKKALNGGSCLPSWAAPANNQFDSDYGPIPPGAAGWGRSIS
jgi:hypothetical protein